jgi:hypothetical protein
MTRNRPQFAADTDWGRVPAPLRPVVEWGPRRVQPRGLSDPAHPARMRAVLEWGML